MNVRNFTMVLALVAFSASSVFAQDFFWSLAPLNGGAVQGDLSAELAVGDTADLYLYYNTANSELDTGGFLDFSTSTAGVINFTDLETFDFDIEVAGNDVGDRWGDSFGPGEVDATNPELATFNAFAVTNGDGILDQNTGPVFLDTGYDADADAFLFGRVGIEVVGEGVTDINIAVGDGLIVHDNVALSPSFGAGTITGVGGDAIPEPTTAGLLAMGLVGLVARRRR